MVHLAVGKQKEQLNWRLISKKNINAKPFSSMKKKWKLSRMKGTRIRSMRKWPEGSSNRMLKNTSHHKIWSFSTRRTTLKATVTSCIVWLEQSKQPIVFYTATLLMRFARSRIRRYGMWICLRICLSEWRNRGRTIDGTNHTSKFVTTKQRLWMR